MKRFAGLFVAALLLVGFSGCGDNVPAPEPADATKDARPAGFEDMMKGMNGQMKKAANPKTIPK